MALPSRSRLVLLRRLAGDTLDVIGRTLDPPLTRERVRQIESEANVRLRADQEWEAPDLRASLGEKSVTDLIITTAWAQDAMATVTADGCRALLIALGYKPINPGTEVECWTADPARLPGYLRSLTALAPMSFAEAAEAAHEIGLPADSPWVAQLDQVDPRLVRHELGWVRRGRLTRDVAYLWLRDEGSPRSAVEIAEAVGCSDHSAREVMRRDPDFAQVRPEGTWALKDWRVAGAEQRYSSAMDAVIEALTESGPLHLDQLQIEVQSRYPVTEWRIQQCMSSNMIGRLLDGRIDLVERGAVPIEDEEPRQPDSIKCVGDVVGVTLTVNQELLRGSGIPVTRWLTWRLGLRTAPSTRHFSLPEAPGEVRVTRSLSNAQVSSLRVVAQRLGLVDGCTLALLLRMNTDTATIKHTCLEDACPAAGQAQDLNP